MEVKLIDFDKESSAKKVGNVLVDNRVVMLGNSFFRSNHGLLFLEYLKELDKERKLRGESNLSKSERDSLAKEMVPIFWGDEILIRPENIDLAIRADEILQEIRPKHKIKFMCASHPAVRRALVERGESYRLRYPPRTEEDMKKTITNSRVSIDDFPIYYYNPESGTRYLTLDDFSRLGELDDSRLLKFLNEISLHLRKRNSLGNLEADFFMTDKTRIDSSVLEGLTNKNVRKAYLTILSCFRDAVSENYQEDKFEDPNWRKNMIAALTVKPEEEQLGLSPEYCHRVKWLPGARIKRGKVIHDPIYELKRNNPTDPVLEEICDSHGDVVKGIVENKLGDIQNNHITSINIASVPTTLCKRISKPGRREVYLLEMGFPGSEEPIVRVIRMQKQGARELRDPELTLARVYQESEKRTQYILDRERACRRLGMQLFPGELIRGEVIERVNGLEIISTYFERDYVFGEATDKLDKKLYLRKDGERRFDLEFASLLGNASAPNIILGRCDPEGSVFFDDGDEILQFDERGMPLRIVVSDFTGSFEDYQSPLTRVSRAYALPVNNRLKDLPEPERFADVYLDSFVKRFKEVQENYRVRREWYDANFSHRNQAEEKYNIAHKWKQVLHRLDSTNAVELGNQIRKEIKFI